MELRRFSSFLLAMACYTLALSVSATPEERAALQAVYRTMKGDYAAGRHDQAEAALVGIDRACAKRCSALVRAQIWLYIGSVRGTGSGDQDGARAAFERALGLDSSLAPDPAYANEETGAAYRAVRARMGLGPFAKTVAHLDPPAAKVGQAGKATPPEGDGYRGGEPTARRYHLEQQTLRGPVIGGAIVLGLGYGVALFDALNTDLEHGNRWLPLPVVGPWMALATRWGNCTRGDCDKDEEGLLFFCGALQGLGAILLTVGLTIHTEGLVPDRSLPVTISPVRVGRSGYGLGVAGAF